MSPLIWLVPLCVCVCEMFQQVEACCVVMPPTGQTLVMHWSGHSSGAHWCACLSWTGLHNMKPRSWLLHIMAVRPQRSITYLLKMGFCFYTEQSLPLLDWFIALSLLLLPLWTHDKDTITCLFPNHTLYNVISSYFSHWCVLNRCWVSHSELPTCLWPELLMNPLPV